MRKRNIPILIRLNSAENAHLKKEVAKTIYSQEQFIRNLIMNVSLIPRPPNELAEILRQLSGIGNNINQIARIANTTKSINSNAIEHIQTMQNKIWQKIKEL